MDKLLPVLGLPAEVEGGRLGDRFAAMTARWEAAKEQSRCHSDGVWSGEIDEAARRGPQVSSWMPPAGNWRSGPSCGDRGDRVCAGPAAAAVRVSRGDLAAALLAHAGLRRANLSGAVLVETYLSGAVLHGVDLRKAYGLTQAQLDTARVDAGTQLPDGLRRPASWEAEEDPTASSP
jgi:hypothetical protein